MPLRRALHEGIIKWSALETRWMLNKRTKGGMQIDDAVAAEVANIRAADVREINQFAHHWPARFGRLTPHVRAQATIMRYDEAMNHRRTAEDRKNPGDQT